MICKAFLATSLLLLASLGVPILGIESAVRASEQDEATLVLAGVSEEPAKILRRYQPLADYLVSHLTDTGVEVGEVKVAPDLETLIEWMAYGEVDLVFDSLYPAMAVIDGAGAQPILRRWKSGMAEYRSVFFARADSELSSLSDLQGQLIALEEPLSTSGYMLPLAYLVEAELNPESKEADGTNPAVEADEIGYVFSGEDQNTIQWVITRKVAAGVIDDGRYLELPEATRAGLTVLVETESLPRQVVVVRSGMDPELLTSLKAALMDMDESEEGQSVLEQFKNTTQFDEFPEGLDAALDRMRELYDLVVNR